MRTYYAISASPLMKTPLIVSSALFCALSLMATAEIRCSASDLIFDSIEPSLKAFADDRGVVVSVDGIGSLPALERLRSDEIDLAIIAFPENEPVPREEFSVLAFAYNAAIVAVNARNPIEEISIGELGGVYGANEEFNFNTWGILASCCGAVEISSQFQVWPAIVSPSSSSATPYSRGR